MKAKAFKLEGLPDPLMMLTEHGDIIWHNSAEQIIENDERWSKHQGALRFTMRLLFQRDTTVAQLKGSQLKLLRELTINRDPEDPGLMFTVTTRTVTDANTGVDNPNREVEGSEG